MSAFLPDFWYLAVQSDTVTPTRSAAKTILGTEVIICRATDGQVYAYADRCPHRGMPMRHGTCNGDVLQCCYHGWEFRTDTGRCVTIPALSAEDDIEPSRFGLRPYPCRDVQGNIWVYMGKVGDAPLPPVPTVPGFDGVAPQISARMVFPCAADVATMGFIDPAHPAFVHTSRWWKKNPSTSLRAKEKAFEPDALGFRMKRHHLKHGANPYRLLGQNVFIDITIQLPGLRIEHIAGDRHQACVLAASTPLTATTTEVHYCVYWTIGWLGPLKPAARWMARDFLRQDYDVAVKLGGGDAPFPPPLYVGDADTQIRWFLRLKKEYEASRAEQRAFANPLKEETLRWRS